MSWSEFLRRHSEGVKQEDIAKAAGVTAPTVSRWLRGKQGVNAAQAAAVARSLRVPVLEAFVAAGFLLPEEARMRPAASPDYANLTNDELLELVRARMREEVMGNAEHPAANKVPDISPAPPNEQLLAQAARRGGPTEQEQAEEQVRRAMAERRASDPEANEEDESDQTA